MQLSLVRHRGPRRTEVLHGVRRLAARRRRHHRRGARHPRPPAPPPRRRRRREIAAAPPPAAAAAARPAADADAPPTGRPPATAPTGVDAARRRARRPPTDRRRLPRSVDGDRRRRVDLDGDRRRPAAIGRRPASSPAGRPPTGRADGAEPRAAVPPAAAARPRRARRRRHRRRRARPRSIEITPPPDGAVPQYTVNDFGTNNTVAGAARRRRDGPRRARLVLRVPLGRRARRRRRRRRSPAGPRCCSALAEWRIASAAPGADGRAATIGYWALVGGRRARARRCSSPRSPASGRDGRGGLDPWIAALGAVSFLIAAGGPLIPQGTADWAGNWSSDSLGGSTCPTLFFVGRAVQLGLLVAVRRRRLPARAPLGPRPRRRRRRRRRLAAGHRRPPTRPPSPIGPGYANPGRRTNLSPHAVTVVGFALAGFFALVAIVMALLDADR